jgi:hypothetical protein
MQDGLHVVLVSGSKAVLTPNHEFSLWKIATCPVLPVQKKEAVAGLICI